MRFNCVILIVLFAIVPLIFHKALKLQINQYFLYSGCTLYPGFYCTLYDGLSPLIAPPPSKKIKKRENNYQKNCTLYPGFRCTVCSGFRCTLYPEIFRRSTNLINIIRTQLVENSRIAFVHFELLIMLSELYVNFLPLNKSNLPFSKLPFFI